MTCFFSFFFFFCQKYIQAFKIEFTLNSNFKFFSLYYILIISCHVLLFHLLITYFLITNFEATPAKAMIVNTQLHFFQFAKCHLIVFFFFFWKLGDGITIVRITFSFYVKKLKLKKLFAWYPLRGSQKQNLHLFNPFFFSQ